MIPEKVIDMGVKFGSGSVIFSGKENAIEEFAKELRTQTERAIEIMRLRVGDIELRDAIEAHVRVTWGEDL